MEATNGGAVEWKGMEGTGQSAPRWWTDVDVDYESLADWEGDKLRERESERLKRERERGD